MSSPCQTFPQQPCKEPRVPDEGKELPDPDQSVLISGLYGEMSQEPLFLKRLFWEPQQGFC